MKPCLTPFTTLVILACGAFSSVYTETLPPAASTSQKAREVVQKSLPYLEKVGTDWMREKKCSSCHNVSFLVWTHNEAAAHGLTVDQKKLDEWIKWAMEDSFKELHWLRLRPGEMEAVKSSIPAEVFEKLQPLVGTTYMQEKEYFAALEKAIGPEALEKHKKSLLLAAVIPKQNAGPDMLSQLLLGRRASHEDPFAKDYSATRSLLLKWQEREGSWLAGGQLPQMRWDSKGEANDATTLWSVLALGTDADESSVRGRDKALQFLKKTDPSPTAQSLALRTLAAQKFGEPKELAVRLKDLLDRQNADGGWSWMKDNPVSDAFSTGQALYALGVLGRDHSDPCVDHAWDYLFKTQGADGSWKVPLDAVTKQPLKLNIFDYWGTAWAAIGIMETLPAQSPANKGTLIFSDDFSSPEVSKAWHSLWPGLMIADGALNISQTKPEHSAVGMVQVGRKDLVIEFKFKLGAATSINAVCNDRDYKEGHGGHICRVSLSPKQIFLADDKERLRNEIEEMKKDPTRKAEVDKLVAGRSQSIPIKLEPARWYQLAMEIVGDEMRVSLDGKTIGYLKSSGLAHPVKSDFYFAVSGKDALFDDVRIWAAEPAGAK